MKTRRSLLVPVFTCVMLVFVLFMLWYVPSVSSRCFELADAYAELSDELGLIYVNTLGWQIPTGGDGIHFSARGHQLFAMKLGQTLREALR